MSGVSFTLHDLRRTFITIAENIDISAYALKRLVNHKMTNDVTAGYIVSDVERLRKPMEQISRRILQYFGIDKEKKILQFSKQ
jgi:integrase